MLRLRLALAKWILGQHCGCYVMGYHPLCEYGPKKETIMTVKQLGQRLQELLTNFRETLEPIETRWLVFGITAFLVIITKALGAGGFSMLLASIYVMFWVTFPRRGP